MRWTKVAGGQIATRTPPAPTRAATLRASPSEAAVPCIFQFPAIRGGGAVIWSHCGSRQIGGWRRLSQARADVTRLRGGGGPPHTPPARPPPRKGNHAPLPSPLRRNALTPPS